MKSPLRVLIVEDSPVDAELVERALKKGGIVTQSRRVDTPEELQDALAGEKWDMVTSDHSMPYLNASEVLTMIQQTAPDTPVIIVSGEIDIDLAVSLMRAGAADYVQKRDLARLPLAVERALHDLEQEVRQAELQEAIRASEENLAITLDSIGDAVISTDLEGRVLRMNPVAEELTGWRLNEARGLLLPEVFHIINEQTREPIQSPLTLVLKEHRVVGLANHTLLIARDGTERPIADSGAPIRDKDGKIAGVVLVFRDQTEQAAREKALQASLANLARAEQVARGGHWHYDRKHKVLTISDTVAEIYGLPNDENLGRRMAEAILPEDRELEAKSMRQLSAGMGRIEVDFRIRRSSDGEIVDIHAAAEWDPDSDNYLGVIQDVTERKRSEQALRDSEQRFRSYIELAPIGVLVCNKDGFYVETNEVVTDITGYSRDELLRMNFRDLVTPEQAPVSAERLLQNLAGEVTGGVTVFNSKEGDVRHWRMKAGRLTDTEVIGFIDDITEQIRASEALRASEARLNAILDRAPVLISMKDLDGNFILANRALDILDAPPHNELLGRNVFEVFPEEVASALWENDLAAQQIPGGLEAEEKVKHRDGTWHTYLTHKFPVYDDERLQGTCAISTDITGRKDAEAQLRFLAAVLENTSEAIISTDQDFRVLSWNRAAVEIYGWTAEEAIGAKLPDLVTPEYLETSREELWRMLADKGEAQAVVIHHRKDGTPRIITGSITCIKDSADNHSVLIGANRDITAQVESARIAESQHELIRLTAEIAQAGGWELDAATRESVRTEGFARIFGEEEKLRTTMDSALNRYTPESQALVYHAIEHAITTGEPYDLELEIITAEGVRKWIRGIGRPVLQDGQVVKIRGMIQDITEQKRREAELIRVTESLERRVEERTAELQSFTQSIAHDLRAPLRYMRELTRILTEEHAEELQEEATHLLGGIVKSAERLESMMDALMLLSRTSSAEMQLEELDLSRIAAEAVEGLKLKEPDRMVDIKIEPGLRVYADKRLITLLMGNLMGNAWKYTGKREDARIEFYTETQGAKRVFAVRDNGAGFNPKYSDRLFVPFRRLHSEDAFPGHGLGLSIVARIVKRHGGWIRAEGEVGNGAVFYFTLGK